MKVSERNVAVLVSSEGREVLEQANIGLSDSPFLWIYAEDSDDMGVWARIARQDGDHLLLIRWEYIWSIDFPAGQPKSMGIR